ncbi:MAG: sulfite exporter TauE/SafE family protein [Acidobacteriota bacterium]
METSTFAVLALGFFLGLKHAVEADHLAAVGTIVSERKSLWSSAIVGGIWGLGHTISLFVAGVFVLLLNFQISEQTERILEFCVGIMLLFLGLNVFRKIIKGGNVHFHTHEHGTREHVHPHLHELDKIDEAKTHHGLKFNSKALLIGMVHGLAGSAALMLLVIPTIHSRPLGLLYIAIFGIGSIGGMMLMSFLVGLPFHLTASRFNQYNRVLQGVAGLVSIVFGLLIIYEKGVTEGLFS